MRNMSFCNNSNEFVLLKQFTVFHISNISTNTQIFNVRSYYIDMFLIFMNIYFFILLKFLEINILIFLIKYTLRSSTKFNFILFFFISFKWSSKRRIVGSHTIRVESSQLVGSPGNVWDQFIAQSILSVFIGIYNLWSYIIVTIFNNQLMSIFFYIVHITIRICSLNH